jgi:hypothetical protein
MGVSAFTLIARNLVFQLNSTSVTNGRVLDWNDTPVASANISLGPTDPTFRIGGSVGFRVADVVFGNATLNMTRRTVSGVVDPDGATKRLSGELLGLNISAATLFIGTGASLDVVSTSTTYGRVTLPPVNDPSAVGFRVENGALDLAVFTASKESTDGTNDTGLTVVKKFTGFEGDLGAAQLQGVDAVKLIGTGLYLKLNRTSVTNGAVLNWTQTPLLSSNVALGPNDPTFQIGGTVALSIADLVFGRATVDVRRTQVSGVNYRTATGSTELLQGELLGIAITNATLFIGTGATLNTLTGALTLPEATDTSAVGFSVTGGSLDLGVFTARSRSTNGGTSYSTLLTPRKYTGLEGALGTARLQGVDAFKLTGTALSLKLNQTSVSGAAVLDWRQTAVTTNVLASAGVDLGPTDPTFQIGGSDTERLNLNIGDALKRVSGITMQNDQGEARNIIVRGLAPQLNSVTINGERIPSAEGDNRNIMAAQLALEALGIHRDYAKVNDPVRAQAYAELGIGTICRTTMMADGLRKCCEGLTTIEEVGRVTSED